MASPKTIAEILGGRMNFYNKDTDLVVHQLQSLIDLSKNVWIDRLHAEHMIELCGRLKSRFAELSKNFSDKKEEVHPLFQHLDDISNKARTAASVQNAEDRKPLADELSKFTSTSLYIPPLLEYIERNQTIHRK